MRAPTEPKTKRRNLKTGKFVGGGRFGAGSLNNLLRNRFYIGDVVYRGETNSGEHDPILDRPLFDAVQEMLSKNAVERRNLSRGSAALLVGKIYDERENRMTPSHSNKRGVRYRYYVSQAVLQRKNSCTPRVKRISAPDVEDVVLRALRDRLRTDGVLGERDDDREMIERFVKRITVKSAAIEVLVTALRDRETNTVESDHVGSSGTMPAQIVLNIPWVPEPTFATKGVTHAPSSGPILKDKTRETLLAAIAKARAWMIDVGSERVGSVSELDPKTRNGERHIRLLMSLAFASPETVRTISEGAVNRDLTVTRLARNLPNSWAEQRAYLECGSIR